MKKCPQLQQDDSVPVTLVKTVRELGELCVWSHPIISLMSCPGEGGWRECDRKEDRGRQREKRNEETGEEKEGGKGDRNQLGDFFLLYSSVPFLPSNPFSPHL